MKKIISPFIITFIVIDFFFSLKTSSDCKNWNTIKYSTIQYGKVKYSTQCGKEIYWQHYKTVYSYM